MTDQKRVDLRYLPDTYKQVAQTFRPYYDKLSRAFRDRIALVKAKARR